jgi:hypothetical protein
MKKYFTTGARILAAVVAMTAAVSLTPVMNAQVIYGSLVGTVEDSSGGVIPNATVTLTNKGTGQLLEDKADAGGRYTFSNLSPGSYDLKLTSQGFKTQSRTDVIVSANTVTRVDVKMDVGAVTDQVTVAADVATLQTDKADTHTELNSQQVVNLPLPGLRNYQSLINLVPGATPAVFQNSVTDTPQRSLRTNINGTNANNNVTRIDGSASVNLWLPHHAGYVVPAEMLDTVNISTSAHDAEQGMAGGAAVTLITKSGTNQIKGSAFWFHDNQQLRARNFFFTPTTVKPVSRYNNFGGTIGGPIVKNKLFFFYSYDDTRQGQGSFALYSVPTAPLRVGDFSGISTVMFDPDTGAANGTGRTPFAGNRIPTSRISPIATKILSYIPLPNVAGTELNNFAASATPLFKRRYNDFKINYNPSANHTFFGRYGIMNALSGGTGAFGDAIGGAPGSDPGLGDTQVQSTSAGHNWTLSPTILVDGVIGFQRMGQVVRGNDFGKDYATTLGIPGLGGPDPRQKGFPNLAFSGYTGTGVPGWMPAERIEESFNTSHNLSWLKGSHTLRFGFDGVLHRLNHWQPELGAGPRGSITFSGGTTAQGGTSANNFNSVGALLLGLPSQMQKSLQNILNTTREYQFGWYAQDRWQVSRKLTVSLGLRAESYPLMGRAAGKGLERYDAETNIIYLGGRGNIPRANGFTVKPIMFAPRVGLAYRLDDKTVIRTGYGLTNSPLPWSRPLRGQYPLVVNFAFNSQLDALAVRTLAQGIPDVVGPDLSSGSVFVPAAADIRTPPNGRITRGYVQSWNLTFERNLPGNIVTSLGYVGTQTTNQLGDVDINASRTFGGGASSRIYASRFGRTVATNLWDGFASSNYHALQTAVRRSFAKGLMLQGAYTWSKAINMFDDEGWAGLTWNAPFVMDRNRAAAGYDRRHVFQMGWVYQLPFGKGKSIGSSNRVLSNVVGGWSVNGIFAAYTGTPFTPSAPAGTLNMPGNSQTANQVNVNVARPELIGSDGRFYDITAFAAPVLAPGQAGVFGTMGRNSLRNPGIHRVDMTLDRTFTITERLNLRFRAEAFNAFNSRLSTGFASADVTNGNFLRVTSAADERQFRLSLRLGF